MGSGIFWIEMFGFVMAGVALGYFVRQRMSRKMLESSETLSTRIIAEAKKEAETIKKEAVLQAKDNLLKVKSDLEKETREKKDELDSLEKRIRQKEENLEKRMDLMVQKESNLEKREKSLMGKESHIEEKRGELDRVLREQNTKLEKIAGITAEEAKTALVQSIQEDARRDAGILVRNIEEEARRTAEKKASEILAHAVQRYAGDFVAENSVSVVTLPSEEMKGRIIGREGRNIRAIEAATGTDLIIDDTPEAVVLSSFNPIRREIARLSLERLISDGRIHPGRIEDVVKKVTTEVENIVRETGERVSFDSGVHDVHPEIINLLGKLKYRTSFSQNVLQHSVEVAHLAGIMAAELRLNVKEAKRAGLLHDIGKAVIAQQFPEAMSSVLRLIEEDGYSHTDAEREILDGYTHCDIGAWLAGRWSLPPAIVESIEMHHAPSTLPNPHVLTHATHVADALCNRFGIRSTNANAPCEYEQTSADAIGVDDSLIAHIEERLDRQRGLIGAMATGGIY